MMYRLLKLPLPNLITALALFICSISAQAGAIFHSGVNCQAANQAQADLMTWSKDGVENNASIDLFVICPVDFDNEDFSAANELETAVIMWMPPDYGNAGDPGPFCAVRYTGLDQTLTPTPTNDVPVQDAKSGNVGTFMGVPGVTGSVGLLVFSNLMPSSTIGSVHLLCLLPKNGGTLQFYGSETQ